jgi:excisionase family DNA binding protein
MITQHSNNSDILTEKDVANILSVKPRTVRLWRHSRGLPFIKITTKEIRFRRADIDEWLERRRVAMVA